MRSLSSALLAVLSLWLAGAAAAQPTYPLSDDVETVAVSESYWTADGSASIVETGSAYSGTRAWDLGAGSSITFSGPVDLTNAENPYLSFYVNGYVFAEVSDDDGATWDRLGQVGVNGWSRAQWSLENYRTSDVRLRIRHWSGGTMIDDIRLDDAPFPQSVLLSEPGNHQTRVSWGQSTAEDFGVYRVVLATQLGDTGYSNSTGSNWVRNGNERIQFEIDQKTTLDTLLTDLAFFNRTYYARVYERDTQDFVNQGTGQAEIQTAFNVATETAPFVQDFEGDHGWASDLPWAVTDTARTEPGHSPTQAFEDSPGGVYGGYKNARLVTRVDFGNVSRPVLRFNHRYQFDSGDYATVSYATDNGFDNKSNQGSVTELARFGGTQGTWTSEEIDLGAFNARSQNRTGFLVFTVYTNSATNRDGWHLDDVEVSENEGLASFPFFDDVEDEQATRARWIDQTATYVETGEGTAYSGTHVWQLGSYDNLTLAGSVDLTNAENPYLSFYVNGYVFAEVSDDDGATWDRLGQVGTNSWERAQWSLENYRTSDVRLRIRHWSGTTMVDDILLSGTFPENAITVDAASVQFDPLEVGGQDTVTVSVFNPGTTTVTGIISVSGEGFQAVSGTGAFSLATNEQQNVKVAFAPPAEGSFVGTISVAHSADNQPSPIEVELRGRTPGAVTCNDVTVAAGWNLVSVPTQAESMLAADLFPGTTSHYAYAGGYQAVTGLATGTGYWLKSDAAQQIEICGDPVGEQLVELAEGWNLIGGFDALATTASLGGSAVLGSSFYRYADGYQAATALTPGEGYWIKADAAGTLTFGGGASKQAVAAAEAPDAGWLRLEVTDAEGRTGTLYLAETAGGRYVLPPMPPQGVFDVRFGSDRYVAEAADAQTVRISGAAYPLTVRAANLGDRAVTVTDALGTGRVHATLGADGGALTLDAPVGDLAVQVGDVLPEDYALEQNYPNPFNPRTTIRYSLPEAAQVTVAVYNTLGERVATLVDAPRTAGRHEVAFDGTRLASGVYFVHIRAGAFQAMRQMVLLK